MMKKYNMTPTIALIPPRKSTFLMEEEISLMSPQVHLGESREELYDSFDELLEHSPLFIRESMECGSKTIAKSLLRTDNNKKNCLWNF